MNKKNSNMTCLSLIIWKKESNKRNHWPYFFSACVYVWLCIFDYFLLKYLYIFCFCRYYIMCNSIIFFSQVWGGVKALGFMIIIIIFKSYHFICRYEDAWPLKRFVYSMDWPLSCGIFISYLMTWAVFPWSTCTWTGWLLIITSRVVSACWFCACNKRMEKERKWLRWVKKRAHQY